MYCTVGYFAHHPTTVYVQKQWDVPHVVLSCTSIYPMNRDGAERIPSCIANVKAERGVCREQRIISCCRLANLTLAGPYTYYSTWC